MFQQHTGWRIILVTCILAVFWAAPALAKKHRSERDWSSMPVTSVEQAKKLPDDTYVVIEGQLVEQLKHDEFVLRDATGSIQVEIKNKHWAHGHGYEHDGLVRVYGKVDVDHKGVEIEAKRVEGITH